MRRAGGGAAPRRMRRRAGSAPAADVLEGRTGLFITPGHRFAAVDGLITNFHLPRTSLLALVMAFCGVDETRRIYAHAVARRYRFYSFGDAMLGLAWGRRGRRERARRRLRLRARGQSGRARAGRLRTPHGEVLTPVLHAGGHQGHGQGRAAAHACARWAPRSCWPTPTTSTCGPGVELVRAHGGLHRFMGWDGPILTDSGGFQVFSLADTRVRGRRGRRVHLGLRRLAPPVHAAPGDRGAGGAGRRHRDVLRRVRARHAEPRRDRARRGAHHALGGRVPRRADAATTSSSSASSRAAPTPSCAGARRPSCWPSTSAPTPSAACRSASAATRCSPP